MIWVRLSKNLSQQFPSEKKKQKCNLWEHAVVSIITKATINTLWLTNFFYNKFIRSIYKQDGPEPLLELDRENDHNNKRQY